MPASCPGGLKSPGRGRQRIPQTGGSIASIAILWPYSRFPLQLPDPARHLRPSPAGGDGRELCAVVASQRLARGHRHRLRPAGALDGGGTARSEEHTSELQSLMRISYAVFCLKKKKKRQNHPSIKYNNTL